MFCVFVTPQHPFPPFRLRRNKVPAASAVALPPWLLKSAVALFDCAYAKAPSAVRVQFEAAAPHLSSVGLASAAVPKPLREATINVVDGLLLLLEQALLQVCDIIIKSSTRNTPRPSRSSSARYGRHARSLRVQPCRPHSSGIHPPPTLHNPNLTTMFNVK